MLRIKGYLICRRNATRDYVDFVALSDHLGVSKTLKALEPFDQLYPQEGDTSITQQLVIQLSEPKPWDLSGTDLSHYKSLQKPYTDWNEVIRRAHAVGQRVVVKKLQE